MSELIVEYNDVEIQLESELIIKGLNIKINKGEFVYMIGKTGSGKSSILKSMYSEKKIISGKAIVSNVNLNSIRDNKIPILRRKIGIIFQDFQLLKDRSVYNNLDFVLRATGWKKAESRRKKIEMCLSRVHIMEHSSKFPNRLSGGEKQKVAIARALLNDPEIIIADEPTGNLDPKSSIEIMEVLKEINENGNTILMATHDFTLLKKYSARILRCKNGIIDEIYSSSLDIEKIYS